MRKANRRKYVERMLSAAIATAVLTCFTCCGAADSGAEENSRLILSRTQLELDVGESAWLTTTFQPVSDKIVPVSWRSADSAIATVENGLVTGVAAGETFITAQTREKTVSCKVLVKNEGEKGAP